VKVKYTWAANRITEEDMEKLYRLKKITGKPITLLVSEAVSNYLRRQERENKGGGNGSAN
jgi:predicted DNA-binding protein